MTVEGLSNEPDDDLFEEFLAVDESGDEDETVSVVDSESVSEQVSDDDEDSFDGLISFDDEASERSLSGTTNSFSGGSSSGASVRDVPEAPVKPGEVVENERLMAEARAERNSASGADSKAKSTREVSVKDSSRVIHSGLEQSRPVSEVYEPLEEPRVGPELGDTRLTPGEQWEGREARPVKQRYRWVRDNGKLNGAELEFFSGLGISRRRALSGEGDLDYLKPPVHMDETDRERKERLRKVTEAVFGRDAFKRGSKLSFGEKERSFVNFLALFKYANAKQLSALFAESPVTSYNRLKKLRSAGLVVDKALFGAEPVWFLTDAGMLVSGFDLSRVTESKLTFSMFPHQFTVNHVAANLWGGNVNVLNLKNFPAKNRLDIKGRKVLGEELVSELQVQSSFAKLRLFDKADVYLPKIKDTIDREFGAWEKAGGVKFGPSPEQVFGNEYMWMLYPPLEIKLSYHAPDLVMVRPRGKNGQPNSVAIEIELANKSEESYRRTLQAYKYDKRIYRGVVWVCKTAGAANKLKRAADDIGLSEDGRISIVPILTADGVFRGKDLWTL